MSGGVNKVILIGNLGRDPEVRYTQAGNAVCNLRLAVNERRKVDDEWKDATEWIDVVTFGKTAENVGQYLTKGRQVYVEGRMQTRKWKDRDGHDRWSTEVVAVRVNFIGSRGESSGAPAPSSGHAPEGSEPADGFYDGDLPF